MPPLQPFKFDQSRYERPNQTWVCGRARDGQCCLAGPDARGGCTATTECHPLRKGDRWHCTRPAFQGGACEPGPSPTGECCRAIPKCRPIRSLRSWRGMAVWLTVGAALAVLLVALGSPRAQRWFSPGPLAFAHESLRQECAACHPGLKGAPAAWLADTNGAHSARVHSELCLDCHPLGGTPLQPHSRPAGELARLTRDSLARSPALVPPARLALATLIAGGAPPAGEAVACAQCHQEHRGRKVGLKDFSNQQCQGCHAAQFTSFAAGHPEFTRYPFQRRTRINFNHVSHFGEHFNDPAKKAFAPTTCTSCHRTDSRGMAMLNAPFEAACAACHNDQIKAVDDKGLPFLTLPRMDDSLLDGPYAIGDWPEDGTTTLPPFLALLLSGDPALRPAVDLLRTVKDLGALPKNDPAKIKAAQAVAWGIKSLLNDVSMHGQEELLRRIIQAVGPLTNHLDREAVVAQLPADALIMAFGSLTNLEKQVKDFRELGKAAPTQLISAPGGGKAMPPAWLNHGGWYRKAGDFSLYYHPQGHQDRFLQTWLRLAADASRTANPDAAKALFTQLFAPKAIGLCAKCHSRDDQPGAPMGMVNWSAGRPDPLNHPVNRFQHSSHLSLMDDRGCQTCHAMDGKTGGDYSAAFAPGNSDPRVFTSNFKTMDKAVCAQCHRPGAVRDDCLLCHNYHQGRFQTLQHRTELVVRAPTP